MDGLAGNHGMSFTPLAAVQHRKRKEAGTMAPA